MTDSDSVYWEIIGLKPASPSPKDEKKDDLQEKNQLAEARKAALSRAHEIRKFEIELYWKRAAHFWLLQAAVFAAIGLSWRGFLDGSSPLIPIALAALGTVTAFAGYLSAKGSKFWQENWEYHIDMLEDEFEGRLHKTAYVGKDGVSWSVSGINSRLAMCFFVFWLLVSLFTSILAVSPLVQSFSFDDCLLNWFQTHNELIQLLTIIFILALMGLACLLLFLRKSYFTGAKGVSLTGSKPRIEGKDSIDVDKLPDVETLSKKKKPFLIRREPNK